MSLTCMFFGHDPSHQIDLGREKGGKIGLVFFWMPDRKAVCRRCNAQLDEKYCHSKLLEVIPAGVS